jgi:hypothetical protein
MNVPSQDMFYLCRIRLRLHVPFTGIENALFKIDCYSRKQDTIAGNRNLDIMLSKVSINLPAATVVLRLMFNDTLQRKQGTTRKSWYFDKLTIHISKQIKTLYSHAYQHFIRLRVVSFYTRPSFLFDNVQLQALRRYVHPQGCP